MGAQHQLAAHLWSVSSEWRQTFLLVMMLLLAKGSGSTAGLIVALLVGLEVRAVVVGRKDAPGVVARGAGTVSMGRGVGAAVEGQGVGINVKVGGGKGEGQLL